MQAWSGGSSPNHITTISNPWTIFLTFKFSAPPTTDMILDGVAGPSNSRFHWNGGSPYFAAGAGLFLSVPAWDASTVWARVTIQVNGTGANACFVRVNGAQVVQGTNGNNTDVNSILIGGDSIDSCCWTHILYQELLYYQGALTLAEIQQVEQYQLNRINGLQ